MAAILDRLGRVTNRQWRVMIGMVVAGCTFLLVTQTDVELTPVVRVALGLIITVLAVIQVPPDDPPPAP